MASGKSTVGRALAKKTSLPFYDLDSEIEKDTQMSITDIINKLGETYFRDLETKKLEEFVNKPKPFILSTGGGTPCYNNNINLLNSLGKTIYIKSSESVIYHRLLNNRRKRPLISSLNNEELKNYISTKYAERDPVYSQANLTIFLDKEDIETVINTIFSEC